MPRIPYRPDDNAGPEEIVAAIRARRGGHLMHLDRMLLHSPHYATAWNGYLKTVRTGLDLPAKLREIAICVVASLNDAEYEFHHHTPELAKAGATAEQIAALREPAGAVANEQLFNRTERAVIRLTMEMTRHVSVSDETFEAARTALDNERQVVELVGVIATYNMVSRFLVALGVELEQERP